ncbi:MAG: hypothetical protein Q8N51_11830, partial [Gammaproteobacteria bacterium]|nr:hypothetical protein [Gammaproteobacteria bacterium]
MHTARTLVSLDGPWNLAYDPGNRGIQEQWFSSPPAQDVKSLQLPVMQAQGIAGNGGVGWYFKTFEQDATWTGQHAELQFESVNYPFQLWLNGTRLGDHPGGGA